MCVWLTLLQQKGGSEKLFGLWPTTAFQSTYLDV